MVSSGVAHIPYSIISQNLSIVTGEELISLLDWSDDSDAAGIEKLLVPELVCQSSNKVVLPVSAKSADSSHHFSPSKRRNVTAKRRIERSAACRN